VDKYELQKIRTFAKNILTQPSAFGHTWDHIERVVRNAHWIVEKTGVKVPDLTLLEAACCLHDLPVVSLKKGWLGPIATHIQEKDAIKEKLPKILDNFSLTKDERNTLFTTIYNHPFSQWGKLNRDKDAYSQVLQDADTLDGFDDARVASYKVKNAPFYYMLAVILSRPYLWFYRKNIRHFLNFPEIAKDLSY
jgi:hypothetical protein